MGSGSQKATMAECVWLESLLVQAVRVQRVDTGQSPAAFRLIGLRDDKTPKNVHRNEHANV